jgi:uncharacterized protein with GYD domain
MPSYLVQVSYTQSALSAMVQHPENRAEAIRKPIENLGGKAGPFWFSFGDYDIVGILEMPNNVSAAAFALAIGARRGLQERENHSSAHHRGSNGGHEERGHLRLQTRRSEVSRVPGAPAEGSRF